jgi:hypothetical protein
VSPAYPITPAISDSLNGFDPNLRIGYVQSWNVELQRELSHASVIDIRYTGNHGVGEWRQFNLNEVNTFENGFQKEFYNAQNNLAIANGVSVAQLFSIPTANLKNNFGNQGLPGQVNIPIYTTALAGATADTTIATQLARNQVGGSARDISTNTTRMGRLLAAGYPANFFVVNPDVGAVRPRTAAHSSFRTSASPCTTRSRSNSAAAWRPACSRKAVTSGRSRSRTALSTRRPTSHRRPRSATSASIASSPARTSATRSR